MSENRSQLSEEAKKNEDKKEDHVKSSGSITMHTSIDFSEEEYIIDAELAAEAVEAVEAVEKEVEENSIKFFK